MLTVVGGLLAAVCWSAAGLASSVAGRRVGPMLSLAWVNVAATVIVVALALAIDGLPHDVRTEDLAWAAIYGLSVVAALATAFSAMAAGPVGLVSPIISTEGAFATLLGLALGETVGGATGVALAIVVAGIVLSGIEGGDTTRPGTGSRRTVLLALASAILFAVTLVSASRADSLGALWTIVVGRAAGVLLISIPVLHRERLRRPAGAYRMLAINCAGDLIGFTLFIESTGNGVAVPAVLASQYATLTAIFGYLVFHERLRRLQWIGVALAIVGTALVAATTG